MIMENEVIKTIKMWIEHPGLFGMNKISDLDLMLRGYEFGLLSTKNDKELKQLVDFRNHFRVFVQKKCETTIDYDWVKLIELNSGPSDSHTLKLFNQWFKEFLSSST